MANSKMIIAAAQTKPVKNNTGVNIEDHCRLIELSAQHAVQLIVFPEMSLTGYQRELAAELVFSEDDPKLETLKKMSVLYEMIIIAGAPIKINQQIHIGSFILFPDNTLSIYTKQYLHEGEEHFFSPNFHFNPLTNFENEKIALAICADITNPLHPANANKNKATLYVASLFYTPGGIAAGHENLAFYAKKYSMSVLMSNYGGPSWGLESGGQSAFWNNKGELIGQMKEDAEGLLIAESENEYWKTRVINS